MFQFSPLAPPRLCIQRGVTRHDSRRVSPFGHLRINAYVRLPEDYRSLSRPSSPVRAKASTVRPCSLDRISATRPKTGLVPGPPFLRTHSWCSSLLDSFTHPSTLVFKQLFRSLPTAAEPSNLPTCLASVNGYRTRFFDLPPTAAGAAARVAKGRNYMPMAHLCQHPTGQKSSNGR